MLETRKIGDSYVSLAEITSKIGSGATPRGGKESYKEEGISLIRSLNVYDYIFKYEQLAYIDEAQAEKLRNVKVEANDILLNITGASVCRCCMVPAEVLPARVNQHVAIVRINPDIADPRYVLNTLNSQAFKDALLNISMTGATREALTKSDIQWFRVPLPSLPVQRKIAAILTAYDDMIDINKRRIALLEQTVEELYREWFVRMRFPGHKNIRFIKGVPEGWEPKSMGALIEHYIGGGWGEEDQTSGFSESAFVIRGTDIPKVQAADSSSMPFRFHTPSNLKSRIMQPDDFVFEASGGSKNQLLGRNVRVSSALLDSLPEPVIPASFCKLIRFNRQEVSPYLMQQYLKLFYEQGLVGIFQVQSTGISNYQFESFLKHHKMLTPPGYLQEQFENAVKPMLDLKDQIGLKNAVATQARDLLLPRLISSKLAVEGLDIQFPPSMQEASAAPEVAHA